MPIDFRCPRPKCGRVIAAPAFQAGGRVSCPYCGVNLRVPRQISPAPLPGASSVTAERLFDRGRLISGVGALVLLAGLVGLVIVVCNLLAQGEVHYAFLRLCILFPVGIVLLVLGATVSAPPPLGHFPNVFVSICKDYAQANFDNLRAALRSLNAEEWRYIGAFCAYIKQKDRLELQRILSNAGFRGDWLEQAMKAGATYPETAASLNDESVKRFIADRFGPYLVGVKMANEGGYGASTGVENLAALFDNVDEKGAQRIAEVLNSATAAKDTSREETEEIEPQAIEQSSKNLGDFQSALDALQVAVGNGHKGEADAIVRSMVEKGGPGVADALAIVLTRYDGPSYFIDRAAIRLAEIADQRLVVTLIDAIGKHYDSAGTQQKVIRALGRLKDSRAIEPLVAVLRNEYSRLLDDESKNRMRSIGHYADWEAAKALAQFETPTAESAVREYIRQRATNERKDPEALRKLVYS